MSQSIDFLTISVGTDVAVDLVAATKQDEDGYAGRGFAKSERRLSEGGKCWRRWEPHQPSKDWGLEYENWEWSGGAAQWPAEFLTSREGCRPSRVDVAFDFECDEAFMSDHLVPHYQAFAEGNGISLGIAGQGEVNTRYIGAKSSDRRIRVYRKDLQDAVLAELIGPILRIEIEIKGKWAAEWWQAWRVNRPLAMSLAAGHVRAMTGLSVVEAVRDVPTLAKPEASDEAANLFQFIRQHGDKIAVLHDCGVPIVGLSREYAGMATNRTRTMRNRKRRECLLAADTSAVTDLVRRLLRMPSAEPA